MKCPLCQTENSDTAVFCQKCGYNFPANADLNSIPTQEFPARKNTLSTPLIIVCLVVALCGLCGVVGSAGLYFKNRDKNIALKTNSNVPVAPPPSVAVTPASKQPTVGATPDILPTSVPQNTPIQNLSDLSIDKFNRLQNGMTYQEAVRIIGAEGKISSQSEYADQKTILYEWKNKNGRASIFCTFRNGKLAIKSQFGL